MASDFPNSLDNFQNPVSGTLLNASGSLRHSVQHTNINDSMEAVQSRIGVTGSTDPTTIDFQLSDTTHGHNHDGVNSRTIADLRLLVMQAPCGPFEAFGSPLHHETTYVDKVFPSTRTWYTDSSKTKKIFEQVITYNSNKTPNTIAWKIYEEDGSTVKTTATDTISYSSGSVFETGRTRTLT